MTQPIDRETAIDLVKKANSVKHGPESSSDHTAYLLGIDAVQRLCDLAVAHSRKDAEAVASDSLGQPDNLEVIIDAFIEDYEMIGETEDGRDACHTPTEGERALIKDAICGLLVDTDWDNAWGAHIKSLAHPPEAHKLLQQALEYAKLMKLYGPALGYGNTTIDDHIAAIRTYLEIKNA